MRIYKRKSLAEKFWPRVDKTSDPNGCWLWTGCKSNQGYGRLWLAKRKYTIASRVALILDGRPPGELFACHHCDNPSCVNPAHLFVGSSTDNQRDCMLKGRAKPPPKATPELILKRNKAMYKRRKLTPDQAKIILDSVPLGYGDTKRLCEQLGVSSKVIWSTANGSVKWGLGDELKAPTLSRDAIAKGFSQIIQDLRKGTKQ